MSAHPSEIARSYTTEVAAIDHTINSDPTTRSGKDTIGR